MSFEEKFSKQIDDFQRYGTYTYEYDQVGNVIFNSSSNDFSQIFIAFPMSNFIYDNAKILNFYDPNFTEFMPSSEMVQDMPDVTQLQTDLDAATQQNSILMAQLDAMITQSETNPSSSIVEATKQVIIELRRQLGQGNVESDFSTDFPYSPLRKAANINTDTTKT